MTMMFIQTAEVDDDDDVDSKVITYDSVVDVWEGREVHLLADWGGK